MSENEIDLRVHTDWELRIVAIIWAVIVGSSTAFMVLILNLITHLVWDGGMTEGEFKYRTCSAVSAILVFLTMDIAGREYRLRKEIRRRQIAERGPMAVDLSP